MREFLQDSVADDSLDMKVGEGWPNDPVYGTVKDLIVSYWDGTQIKSWTGKDGAGFTLRGTKPAWLSEIQWLPEYVAEGQRISHSFGKAGTFKLESGPQGAAMNSAGVLSWYPDRATSGTTESPLHHQCEWHGLQHRQQDRSRLEASCRGRG